MTWKLKAWEILYVVNNGSSETVRGKVYREVLKKRQRSKSKFHHHVKEAKAFCKACAWGV